VIAAAGYALAAFAVGVLLVVASLMRAASRASRAEEQREREGGWRP
jgi:hypothetical protein